jgi:superfamily II DNA helicase RecQ
MVALTATATNETRQQIIQNLAIVSASMERTNIMYICIRHPSHSGVDGVDQSYASCFKPLIDE